MRGKYLVWWIPVIIAFIANNCFAQEFQMIPTTPDSQSVRKLMKQAIQLEFKQPDSAIVLMELAFYQAFPIRDENTAMDAGKFLAEIYKRRGMIERSKKTFEDGLKYCKKYSFDKMLPHMFIALGYNSNMYGLEEEALGYYYNAMQAAEKHGTPTAVATIYTNIAGSLLNYWDINTVLFYLDKADEIAQKHHLNHVSVYVMNNRGLVWEKRDTDTAFYYFNTALALAKQYAMIDMQYLILINIARMSILKRNYLEAVAHLKKAQLLDGEIPPAHRILCVNIMGTAYKRLQKYNKAEASLLKALKIASDNNISIYMIDNYASLAEVYSAMGSFDEAYKYQTIYTRLKDSLQNQHLRFNLNNLEVKYRATRKDKENALQQLKIKEQEVYLRKKNVWIGSISAGSIFLSVLLASLYRTNKHKRNAQNRQILFLQQEQEVLQHQQEVLKQEKEIDQLTAMVSGEERERSRISRELHDGIGGMLSAINMHLNAIQKRYQDIAQVKELNIISRMLDDTTAEVRKAAHNLMPDVLLRRSLKEAVVIYCDQINASSSLQIDFQCYGNLDCLNNGIRLTIYRIIQELTQNIVKHAQATNAVIQIMEHEGKLSITVEDNGIGFNSGEQNSGYGLQNLEFRVRALKGDVAIMSKERMGTTIYIEFETKSLNIL